MTRPVVVIDIVGLTPALLVHMPQVAAVGREGFRAELGTILPAVTCSQQSTFLTGTLPRDHGIVETAGYSGSCPRSGCGGNRTGS